MDFSSIPRKLDVSGKNMNQINIMKIIKNMLCVKENHQRRVQEETKSLMAREM
jgi:hypothetical protein